ncbi:MAG: YdcF family protein [Isosphaeraceae bacterium]|nr:YdcF family protein [Isosphaeraceae bacterium]
MPSNLPLSRRRVRRWLLVTAALAVALALARHPLLTSFARLFRVDDPAPSDVLVLLLGGDVDRPRRVAELYRAGVAPLVLMSTDPDTEMNRRSLLEAGVPACAIRVLGPVRGTHDEALRVAQFVREHPLRRITVVTTAFHTGRARWTFRRVLSGQDVDVRVAASRADQFDESNWYLSSAGRTAYLREVVKSVFYRVNY